MDANKKLVEMFTKYECGNYTRFDAMEDFAIAVIELGVSNKNEREQAKLMVKMARKAAEESAKNNNSNYKNLL